MKEDNEISFKEKLELMQMQYFGKDPTEKQFKEATFDWDNVAPMMWYTKGRPTFHLPLLLLFGLVVFWIFVQILNWNVATAIDIDPDSVVDFDLIFLSKLNDAAGYAGFGALIVGGYIGMYLHLNTWGRFEFQIEPCIVTTLNGDIKTPVLRVYESEEIFPYPHGSKVSKFLEELEEEELLKEIEEEQAKLLEKEGKKEKKEKKKDVKKRDDKARSKAKK